jgi:DNA-binding transcriptional MerR regulator
VKKLFYRIGEACKQLDIQPYVLRYWETEFPVLSPKKSKAGQRVYSEEELRLILRIKQLLYEEGYTIAGAKKKLESELAADSLPELEEGPAPAPPPTRGKVSQGAPAEAGPSASAIQPEAAAAAPPAAPAMPDGSQAASRGDGGAPAAPDVTAAPSDRPAAELDRASAEQVETLRSGLREALAQARDILRLLG